MEIFSGKPINDYVENLYQNGLPEFFDEDEFIELSNELRKLEEELNDLVAEDGRVNTKKLQENHKSLAQVLFMVMHLELIGGEIFEEGFSDDLECVGFNIDDVYNLIEAAKRSKDYTFLNEITFSMLNVLQSLNEKDAFVEVYYILAEVVKEFNQTIVFDASPKMVLLQIMAAIKEQYKEVFENYEEDDEQRSPGMKSVIYTPWYNKN